MSCCYFNTLYQYIQYKSILFYTFPLWSFLFQIYYPFCKDALIKRERERERKREYKSDLFTYICDIVYIVSNGYIRHIPRVPQTSRSWSQKQCYQWKKWKRIKKKYPNSSKKYPKGIHFSICMGNLDTFWNFFSIFLDTF